MDYQEEDKKQLQLYLLIVMAITMFLIFENIIERLVRYTGGVGRDTSQAIALTIKWVMWLMVVIGFPMRHYYEHAGLERGEELLKDIYETIDPFIWLVFLNMIILAFQISRRMRESQPPDGAGVFLMSTREKKTWNGIGLGILCCSLLLIYLYYYDHMTIGLPSNKSVGVALLACTALHSLSLVSYIEEDV